jgi:hypothetical protein
VTAERSPCALQSSPLLRVAGLERVTREGDAFEARFPDA